jgi:hypothetical protein
LSFPIPLPLTVSPFTSSIFFFNFNLLILIFFFFGYKDSAFKIDWWGRCTIDMKDSVKFLLIFYFQSSISILWVWSLVISIILGLDTFLWDLWILYESLKEYPNSNSKSKSHNHNKNNSEQLTWFIKGEALNLLIF